MYKSGKKWKKTLSILLVFAMLPSMAMPMSVLAAPEDIRTEAVEAV